jgi:hypothetical protein
MLSKIKYVDEDGSSTVVEPPLTSRVHNIKLNIVYITNYSRMIESTPVICLLNNEGVKDAIVRYQFSRLECFSRLDKMDTWQIATYEVQDNLDYPDDPDDQYFQKCNCKLLDCKTIDMNPLYLHSQSLIVLGSSKPAFPEIFARVYKAFDTKDNNILLECCNEYNDLVKANGYLETENQKLRMQLAELKIKNTNDKLFLTKLRDDLDNLML